jgi:YggT family protein
VCPHIGVGTLAHAAQGAAADIGGHPVGSGISSLRSGLVELALFFQILGFALFIFWLLLIARVVVEFIRSFSRDWRPTGLTVVVLEIIMSITDPPVKLLRRLIPQLTIGAVRFDLSIMVLLLVAFIGMQLAFGAAA